MILIIWALQRCEEVTRFINKEASFKIHIIEQERGD
jgi:hypothetical protein